MRLTLHSVAGLLLLWSLFLIPARVSGQHPFDPAYRETGASITDHLEVFTDRSIYITGEQIRFRADYFNQGLPGNLPWSSVVYMELLAPDRAPVVVSKWAMHDRFASGSFTIPEEVLTGHYLLRCYTRWMRNRGPESYHYTPLTIINPYRREVADTGDDSGLDSELLPAPIQDQGSGTISCVAMRNQYRPGEWVRITLQAPDDSPPEGIGMCLTVAPEGSVEPLTKQRLKGSLPVSADTFQLQYLPDLGEAFTLSGVMVNKEGNPAADGALSFSLLGPEPDLITANTDPQGRFAVQIPLRMSDQAFLVAPYPKADDSLVVRIDQDMDGRRSPFTTGGFSLSAIEREVATRLAVHWQLMESYQEPDSVITAPEVPLSRTLPFYGSDVERIDLKEYVNLPTLEEIFINLVHGVHVVRRRGSMTFSIEGDNSSIGFYRPLVLVDFIPVFDHHTLLTLDPREFARIEVIREVYVKGSMAFGGVVSLFTRNGDMAGLNLPEGSYFFNVTPLRDSETAEERFSVEQDNPASADRLPDLSNTVFWVDDLHLFPGKSREIIFRAPDGPGVYTIKVQGARSPGRIISGNTRFEVQGSGLSSRMP